MSTEINQNLVTYFHDYLLADGKAQKTAESYCGDVRAFLAWLAEKKTPITLQRIHITSYRNYLLSSHYEINTINKKMNSLLSFNLYLIQHQYMTEKIVCLKKDKVTRAAGSEPAVEILSEADMEKLLFHLPKETVRNRMIVLLLIYTGLRVSELVNIKLTDLDLLSRQLTIAWGKGMKRRQLPLKSEAAEAITNYIETDRRKNKHVTSDYLILTGRAAKMDRDAVNRILQKIGQQLDIKIYPHKFRHTFCTRLLKKGVELTTVAKLAGHASIHTTAAFYINTSKEDKEKAVDLL